MLDIFTTYLVTWDWLNFTQYIFHWEISVLLSCDIPKKELILGTLKTGLFT